MQQPGNLETSSPGKTFALAKYNKTTKALGLADHCYWDETMSTNPDEQVTFKAELSFSDFVDPFSIEKVTSSKTFQNGDWEDDAQLSDFTNGIRKIVLPIDITRFRILVSTTVAPGRTIKAHHHDDEPQFRYIVSGSFTLNGELYTAGDWVIVPTGHTYEISTIDGYTTLGAYHQNCGCVQVGGH